MNTNEELCKKLAYLLDSGRECEWIEFKRNNSNPQQIGECLSALSNSSLLCEKPHGYLVFGIHDKTLEVVGTTFSFFKEKISGQEMENWLATQLNPRVDLQGFEFIYKEKNIVMIKIEAVSDIPVAFKGIEYIRIGSYTKKLKDHPEKARKIWRNKDINVFEEKIAVTDLDIDSIFKLLNYPKYFEL